MKGIVMVDVLLCTPDIAVAFLASQLATTRPVEESTTAVLRELRNASAS